jgi:outer membrane receptor for ferrienterochelin and colicin
MLPSLSGEIDIFKSLQLLPGVQVASELSNGLYIRGGSPDQTLTLVDGMVLYNPSHLGNFTSTFNSNALQDIKLIKGAYPAEYGGRLSSVIDIKLKSGQKEKSKGSIGVGTINSFMTLEGPLTDSSTYILSARTMYYDAILKTFNKDSNIPRYNYFDVNSKLTYNLKNNNNISLSFVYSNDDLYDSKSTNNYNYDIAWQNSALNLNWLKILNTSIFTNTTLSIINYEFETNLSDNGNSVSSSNFFANSSLTDVSLKSIAELRWNSENIAKGGISLTYHTYDVLFSNYYSYALENSQNDGEDVVEISYFVQNESNFDEIFKMNLGTRVNYYIGQDDILIAPRLSFSYALAHYLTLKTGVSKTFQFIHLLTRNDKSLPTDLWYPSNEYMQPSESWQYVFGIEANINNNEFLISLEGYYRDMKHLYEFKNNANYNPFETLKEQITEGEGEAYGVELFLNKRLGLVQGWIGYTYSWTNRKFSEINNGKIFRPRYDRRHDISLALTYEITKNLNIGISWVYSAGERVTMPNGQYLFQSVAPDNSFNINLNATERNGYALPDYHKMDINLTYSFTFINMSLETYLNIYNVYNQYNVFSYYITYKENNGTQTPIINQITMFPFLPTLGVKINF